MQLSLFLEQPGPLIFPLRCCLCVFAACAFWVSNSWLHSPLGGIFQQHILFHWIEEQILRSDYTLQAAPAVDSFINFNYCSDWGSAYTFFFHLGSVYIFFFYLGSVFAFFFYLGLYYYLGSYSSICTSDLNRKGLARLESRDSGEGGWRHFCQK